MSSLLGGFRERLPTYASTYHGDRSGGLDSKEAFAACRYVIDTLKQKAPIWKQEVYVDGTRPAVTAFFEQYASLCTIVNGVQVQSLNGWAAEDLGLLDAVSTPGNPARLIGEDRATVRVRISFDELDPRILPDMGVKVAFRDETEQAAGQGFRMRLRFGHGGLESRRVPAFAD